MGRLIDDDEALDAIDNRIRQIGYEDFVLMLSIRQAVRDVKPVDAVPVVHAHWIRHDYADIVDGYLVPEFECSKCHSWKKDDSDYCPNCGARMDGEQE